MRSTTTLIRLSALALFAMAGSVAVAQPTKPTAAESAAAAKQRAKTDVDSAKQKALVQRDSILAEYESLARQLKDASAEQRKQILERIEQQKKAFEEAQSALHKQIRDEQRRQRQSAGPKR